MKLPRASIFVLAIAGAHSLLAAGFLDQLTPEQRKRMGLDQLNAGQLAELGAAVEGYRRTGEVAAAQQAAATAVAEYKQKEEPGVISRALEIFRKSDRQGAPGPAEERITAVLPGKFTGWSGNTLFRLDNGQVWRQASTDSYYSKARENVPVVIYKSPNGYWRLRVLDDEGAWVTVRRVQ